METLYSTPTQRVYSQPQNISSTAQNRVEVLARKRRQLQRFRRLASFAQTHIRWGEGAHVYTTLGVYALSPLPRPE